MRSLESGTAHGCRDSPLLAFKARRGGGGRRSRDKYDEAHSLSIDHSCVEGAGHKSDDTASRCRRPFCWGGEVRRLGMLPTAYHLQPPTQLSLRPREATGNEASLFPVDFQLPLKDVLEWR